MKDLATRLGFALARTVEHEITKQIGELNMAMIGRIKGKYFPGIVGSQPVLLTEKEFITGAKRYNRTISKKERAELKRRGII